MALEFPSIDPVALSLGPVQIRWYALAYLIGIMSALYYCGRVTLKSDDQRPDKKDLDDFLTWAVLGVVLGGRLGYVLFYQPSHFKQNPTEIFMIWQGGMSFHGGMIGVAIAMLIFSKFRKINVLNLADIVSASVPIGLFFGRIANFINAELYGRVTTLPWGFIFPGSDGLPRHPSQLYEAATEGVLLFFILYLMIYKLGMLKYKGFITGSFLLLYGSFRACIEFVREPDDYIGLIGGFISMGQILCLPMIFAGLLLIFLSFRMKRNEPAEPNHSK